jgi:hypothetical protein
MPRITSNGSKNNAQNHIHEPSQDQRTRLTNDNPNQNIAALGTSGLDTKQTGSRINSSANHRPGNWESAPRENEVQIGETRAGNISKITAARQSAHASLLTGSQTGACPKPRREREKQQNCRPEPRAMARASKSKPAAGNRERSQQQGNEKSAARKTIHGRATEDLGC